MPTTPRARSWSRAAAVGPPLLFVVAVGALGCGGREGRNARAVRVDPAAPVAEECPEETVPPGVERAQVTAVDGTPIGAAVTGTGPTSVVLVHGSGQDLCDWLPVMPAVADLGVRVVAYDLRGRGASGGDKSEVSAFPDDVASVVGAERAGGAERVVLVGTSLGAATALVAAGSVDPPVDGVVAVSPPAKLGGTTVADEARHFAGPVVLLVAKGDQPFAANAAELQRTLPDARGATVLDGSAHGMRLIKAHMDDVLAAIDQAVEASGGP